MKTKYIISIGTAFIFIIAAALFNLHRSSEKMIIEQFQAKQVSQIHHLEKMIASYLDKRAKVLVALASSPSVQNNAIENSVAYIQNIYDFEKINNVSAISICNEKGDIVYSTSDEEIGQNHTKLDYFLWASNIENKDQQYVSSQFQDSDSINGLKFRLVVPRYQKVNVENKQDSIYKFTGAIISTINLDEIINSMYQDKSNVFTEDLLIFNNTGKILYNSKHPTNDLKNVYQQGKSCLQCHTSFDFVKTVSAENEGFIDFKLKDNSNKYVVFSTLEFKNSSFKIVLGEYRKVITGDVEDHLHMILFLIGTITLLILVGARRIILNNNQKIKAQEESKTFKEKFRLEKELKGISASLVEAGIHWQTTFNSMEDSIMLFDKNNTIVKVNKATIKFLGIPEKDIIGRHCWEVVHGTNEAIVDCPIKKMNKSLISESQIIPFHDKWLEINVNPVFDDEGKHNGAIHIIRDITERKVNEEKIKKNEILLQNVLNAMPVGVWLADEKGNLQSTNPAGQKIWEGGRLVGFDKYGEYKGWWADTGKLIKPEEWALARLITKGESSIGEVIEIECFDGTHKIILNSVVPILDENQKITGAIVVNQDITEIKESEKKVQESEEHYRNLVEVMPDAVYKSTHDGKFVDINPAMVKMLGYPTKEELLAIDIKTQLYFDVADRESVVLNEELAEKGIYRMKKKDGSEIWVEDHGWLSTDKKSNIVYHEGVMRDITAKKRTEQIQNIILNISNASQTELDLGNLIEFIQKELGRIVDTKNFFVALYNEVNGTFHIPYYKDLGGDDVLDFPAEGSISGLVIKKEKSLLLDELGMSKLEKNEKIGIGTISKSWLGVPLKIKGKITGVFVVQSYEDENAYTEKDKEILEIVSHQISISIERKRNEETLKINESRLSEAQRIGKLGYIDWNLITNEIDVSEEALRLYGLDTTENIVPVEALTKRLHPDDLDRVNQSLMAAISGKAKHEMEHRIVQSNGNIVYVYATAKLFKDENNKPVRLLGVVLDITERKKTKENLLKALEKSKESDHLKSAFLANMSHEIRTPMNGILGFSELLKSPNLSGEKQHKYINIIEKSGDRLLTTINDIVNISKIESGLVKISLSEININKQVADLYEFFKPEATKKGLKLLVVNSIPEDESIIKMDEEKLHSILLNLIKNAIKFTRQGSVEFGYSIIENQLQFYVKDTGIGIPLDRQPYIFDRFVQADIEDKSVYEGSGLGLAISKSYVEMLGGIIELKSVEGNGATFRVTIPCQTIKKEIPALNNKPSTSFVASEIPLLKILIVEDDKLIQCYLEELLADISKEILLAENGYKALEICRENSDIDLILMDIRIPGMNGYEVTSEIRQFNKEVIIIAQTAFALSGDKEIALEAGCNDYITKPIDKVRLFNLIQNYFKKELL
tara:strand:+ start:7662 stop:11867 length:4206 start_codon:yes stop_codon:yes gene_type:complete